MNHCEMIKSEMERRRITVYRVSKEINTHANLVNWWIKEQVKPSLESQKRIEVWFEKSKDMD